MSPSAVPMDDSSSYVPGPLSKGMTKDIDLKDSPIPSQPAHLSELSATKLIYSPTTSPRPVPAADSPEVRSQSYCTDHMITCEWSATTGWSAPMLKPYGPLSLMPTASCLHYATECFEGLKAYRGYDGRLRLFRPARNCARMRVSAARIALPTFPASELLALITALLAHDGPKWLPRSRPGSFLYLRPSLIGTGSVLGVQTPQAATLFILACLFPSFDEPKPGMPTAEAGLSLLASQESMVRAWPGGFGYAKVGANYGPSLVAQREARAHGFDQILWLFGDRAEVTEAGASNFFVVWRSREGRVELVTAPLDDKIILDGVTRRSVLELASDRLGGDQGLTIVERKFEMREIVEAVEEGRLIEAFASGTAFFIAPVSKIHFRGLDLNIPMADGISGHYAGLIKGWLRGIMYGKERHPWGVVVEEDAN